MKVTLSENGLQVNQYKCNSVTVHQKEKDLFEAVMFYIEGITKKIPKIRRGKQVTSIDGKPVFVTVKGRMNHGPYKDFYESGVIRTEANYRNGKFDGMYTFYHENGQIYVQVEYKRGNLNGDISFFDDIGQLIEVVKYKNGKPINKGK